MSVCDGLEITNTHTYMCVVFITANGMRSTVIDVSV